MSTGPIVAGTDGSATAELAVDKAAELARALGTQMHVATAYPAGSARAWMAATAGTAMPADDGNLQQAAQEIVDRTSARLKRHPGG